MIRMASFRRSFWEEEVGGKEASSGMGVRELERPFADWQLPCDTDGGRGCCSYRGKGEGEVQGDCPSGLHCGVNGSGAGQVTEGGQAVLGHESRRGERQCVRFGAGGV